MIKDIITANELITPNQKEINILKENFPACFRADGSFDITRFSEFLKDKIDITHEGYELKFLGKNYAKMLASLDTETVIVPDEAHNSLPENANSENVYISGDNLDGLKHLLKSYAGQVKCIYIDPPYNTGSDGFVYNDKFNFTVEDLVEKLSIDEEQAQRILDLTNRGSASHSAWLMFMYPRLQLSRDLLAKDGVIFISIDDNEQSNLKLICDDVFGEQNFAGQIAIVNNLKGRNDRANIATTHEYLLMYVSENFVAGGLPLTEEQKKEYKYVDENGNQYSLRDLRKRGRPDRREDRPNMYFPIYYNEETKELSMTSKPGYIKIVPLRGDGSDGRWRWGKDHVSSSLQILHPEKNNKGKWGIKHRVYLNPALNPTISDDEFDEFDEDEERTSKAKSFWQGGELSTDVARRTLKELIPDAEFDYPKSVELIKRVLHMGLSGNTESIVCDFFGGSSTTLQAILEFNVENSSKVKGIIIQLPENMDDKLATAKGEALSTLKKNISFLNKRSRPHTLDYLGIERIESAAKKIKAESSDTSADLGFKHYSLAEVSQTTLDKIEKFDDSSFITDTTVYDEFGTATVLTTWLVHDNYGFVNKCEMVDLAGYTAYWCENHLYFINPGLSENAIKVLVEKYNTEGAFNPQNIVLFGYSFNYVEMENLKTNVKILRDSEKNLKINLDIRY
mgnify:CR=1 FL=1